jgi:hypothetical protein
MNPKRAQAPNHFEPCATLGGITQRMLGMEIIMKQMGEALTRLESQTLQINEKLSALIEHEGRIERLEQDHLECHSNRMKVWDELRALKTDISKSLVLIEEIRASATEDRTTMRDAVGWAIAGISAIAGVFYAGWQMATGK